MNDLTREELVTILLWAIDRLESVGLDEFKSTSEHLVYTKIQSMIANHCEHQYSPTEALNVPLHCMKCGENFE